MADGKEPKLPTNLLFSDVCSGHLDELALSAFDEAIGGLAAGVRRDDLALVSQDPSEGMAADELVVEVGVELLE